VAVENQAKAKRVDQIVDQLEELTGQNRVSVREILEAFGNRSFLPVLMVPALLVVSPLSGIPLLPTICGLTIATVAAQMFAGRDHIWLPRFVMRRSLGGTNAQRAVRRLHGFARWLDEHARDRLRPLMRWPSRKVIQALCILCGAAMPFLELVPFSSSMLGAAVLLFGTALLIRDGLLALLGMILMAAAATVVLAVAGLF
jgi:hypothetical protein